MPYYDFSCNACDAIIEDIFLSYEERDVPTTEPCPFCDAAHSIERLASAPHIGDAARLGRMNLPSGWTDRLARIKERTPGATFHIPKAGKREI